MKWKKPGIWLGLVILSMIVLYWSIHHILTMSVHVKSSSAGNISGWQAEDDWRRLRQTLRLKADVRLEDFQLEWDGDGTIRTLCFLLVAKPDSDGFLVHQVAFDPENRQYEVQTKRYDQWARYNQLVSAEGFFAVLGQLDVSWIIRNQPAPYELVSHGRNLKYAIRKRTKYMLHNGELTPVTDSQLPVQGAWLSLYELPAAQQVTGGRATSVSSNIRHVWDILFDPVKPQTESRNGVTVPAADVSVLEKGAAIADGENL